MFEWTTIIVAVISSSAVVIVGLLTWKSQKMSARDDKQARLEERVENMNKRLDKVHRYLRQEQVFSHGLILTLQAVTHYIASAKAYRLRYEKELPPGLPELPDETEIRQMIEKKPKYED